MKKLLILIIGVLLFGAVAFYFLRQQELVVTVTQEEIQAQLDEVFPVERGYLVVLSVRLSDPRVTLVEGSDRIHYEMVAGAALQPLGRQWTGRGQVSGRLRYAPETRQLFLDEAVVEDLEVPGVPAEYRARVRQVVSVAAGEAIEGRPIYTLDEETLARLPGPLVLRGVEVVDGRVEVTLGLGAAPDPAVARLSTSVFRKKEAIAVEGAEARGALIER
jgi:hypothetical protein